MHTISRKRYALHYSTDFSGEAELVRAADVGRDALSVAFPAEMLLELLAKVGKPEPQPPQPGDCPVCAHRVEIHSTRYGTRGGEDFAELACTKCDCIVPLPPQLADVLEQDDLAAELEPEDDDEPEATTLRVPTAWKRRDVRDVIQLLDNMDQNLADAVKLLRGKGR